MRPNDFPRKDARRLDKPELAFRTQWPKLSVDHLANETRPPVEHGSAAVVRTRSPGLADAESTGCCRIRGQPY